MGKELSVLAPPSLKLLRHESEVAEEENAQAEAQEKKDEAEVQVKQRVHPRSLQEQKGCCGPGHQNKLWTVHYQ